eukprot:320385_1
MTNNYLEANFQPVDQTNNSPQILFHHLIKPFMQRRSDFHGIKQVLLNSTFIILSQYLIQLTGYTTHNHTIIYYPLLILNILSRILSGFALSFIFHGEHECIHHTAFQTPILNDIFANIFGFLLLLPPLYFKYFHWAHHRYTGNKHKDPELLPSVLSFNLTGSLLHYALYLSGIKYWIEQILSLFRHSLLFILDNIFSINFSSDFMHQIQDVLLPNELEYYLQRKYHRYNTGLEAIIFMCLYFLVYLLIDFDILWRYWIEPILIGQIFLRAYLIAEHYGCKINVNMWSNTRTTKTFWLYSKLAWNMSWHLEHHAFPFVPFYLLPEVHEITNKNGILYEKTGCVPNGKNGYLSVHRQMLTDIINKK